MTDKMSDADFAEYQEFLAFKAMKSGASAAPVSRIEWPKAFAEPVRRIDWSKALATCLKFIFNPKAPKDIASANTNWWMWRQIYMADPAAFRLVGELHHDRETGETYITARYDFASTGAYAHFHIYGATVGFYFNTTKATWSQNGKSASARPLWTRSSMLDSRSSASSSVVSDS